MIDTSFTYTQRKRVLKGVYNRAWNLGTTLEFCLPQHISTLTAKSHTRCPVVIECYRTILFYDFFFKLSLGPIGLLNAQEPTHRF